MAHHLLHALLQRHAAAGAALARASQSHLHFALIDIKSVEEDVASICLDTRTDTCVEKLLDQANHFAVALLDVVGVLGDLLGLEDYRLVIGCREEVQ